MEAATSKLDIVPIEVSVVVGSATMPIVDFLRIETGSVLGLGRGLEDPVDLVVSGRIVAKGSLEIFDEGGASKLGVRISEVVSVPGLINEAG